MVKDFQEPLETTRPAPPSETSETIEDTRQRIR